jgi:hypothetical protein
MAGIARPGRRRPDRAPERRSPVCRRGASEGHRPPVGVPEPRSAPPGYVDHRWCGHSGGWTRVVVVHGLHPLRARRPSRAPTPSTPAGEPAHAGPRGPAPDVRPRRGRHGQAGIRRAPCGHVTRCGFERSMGFVVARATGRPDLGPSGGAGRAGSCHCTTRPGCAAVGSGSRCPRLHSRTGRHVMGYRRARARLTPSMERDRRAQRRAPPARWQHPPERPLDPSRLDPAPARTPERAVPVTFARDFVRTVGSGRG